MTFEILNSFIGKIVMIKTIRNEFACGLVKESDTQSLSDHIIIEDRNKGCHWYMNADYIASIEEWSGVDAYWDKICAR